MNTPEISAYFEIRNFACEPDAITALVGVEPTQVWQKGDTIALGKGRRPYAGWRLAAPPLGEVELEPYLKWLLDRLPSELDLSAVTPIWEAQVSFVVWTGEDTPAMFFSADSIRRVGQIGASLDVDLYVREE